MMHLLGCGFYRFNMVKLQAGNFPYEAAWRL
jgi:hypothetical protein